MGRADYEFEGFIKPAGISGGGEICMAPAALMEVFGRKNIQLQTDGGGTFFLRFSDKKLPLASTVAHVDLVGDLQTISGWHN